VLGMFLVSVGTSVHCYCEEKEIKHIRFLVLRFTFVYMEKEVNIRTITCYRTLSITIKHCDQKL
jgi:hypothetical protein